MLQRTKTDFVAAEFAEFAPKSNAKVIGLDGIIIKSAPSSSLSILACRDNNTNKGAILISSMHDPLAPPPAIVVQLLQPFAQRYGLLSLPFHGHEIIGSFIFYSSIFLLISPGLSGRLVHGRYSNLSKRSQIAWHVKVVSTIQSTFICTLALYVLLVDTARQRLGSGGRLWAYSGASGMVQAFAAGYFLWDLSVSVRYFGILGGSSLAHAASALFITCIGFVSYAGGYCSCFLPLTGLT